MRAQMYGEVGTDVDLPRDAQGRLIIDSYGRMSDGFDGKELNVASQFQHCDRSIGAFGGVLGKSFSDPLSAWKRKVVRGEWLEMIERLRTRQSAGVAIYNIDRFLRQPRQLEWLLDTLEEMGCFLLTGGAVIRLDNDDDQFMLRLRVSLAHKESANIRRRTRDKFTALRETGVLVHSGPRPFAWPGMLRSKPGEKKRREASEELVAREVEALRWAFKVFSEKTHNLTDIANAWNEEGLLGFYGNLWTNVTVRQTMMLGRHAGRIEHNPNWDKAGAGRQREVKGMIADHEPNIDPAVFDQVQMTFASRRRGRPSSPIYLGSGILLCSDCLLTMSSRPRYPGGDSRRPGIQTYWCRKRPNKGGGCNRQIDQAPVDEILREVVIKRLSDPAVAGRISEYAMEADVRAIGIEAELTSARETEVMLTTKLAMGELSNEAYSKGHPLVLDRIRKLETQLAQLSAAAEDLGAVKTQSELSVSKEWDGATTERRREMLKAATRLVRIAILPGGGHGSLARSHIPPQERVLIEPLGA